MSSRLRDYKNYILAAVTLLIFGVAVWVLHGSLARMSWDDVVEQLRAVPRSHVALAVLFCCGSYGMLTLYDFLALRAVGKPLPYARMALTSFIAFAISHSVGVASVSGGSIRFRGYSGEGLGALEIAGVQGLIALSFFLGVGSLLSLSLMFESADAALVLHLTPDQARALGALLLALLCGYLLLTRVLRAPLRVRSQEMRLPAFHITLGQLATASIDLCLASATLYVLLPQAVHLDYFGFVSLYVLALLAGAISNVPGGLGVFESVLALLLPGTDPTAIAGAILLYRLIYYLIPFIIGLTLLAALEAVQRRHHIASMTAVVREALERFAPQALGGLVFIGGAVLLISGATPEIDTRMDWLRDLVPDTVLELSHLTGSAVGVALLVLARGLFQRLDGAWWMTMLLLAGGVAASLLKGLDWEEASLLLLLMGLLWGARQRFYRRASLLDLRYSRVWIIAIACVVGTAVLVTIASYRDIQYARELWWQFAFDEDAPRAMRAGLLAVLLAAGYMLWQLLSPARPEPAMPTAAQLDRAAALVEHSDDTLANLVLLGDKQVLFAEAGDAFIMYQRSGRSIVALGDPVGNPARYEELAWRFVELCDRSSCWPVFYQVTVSQLPLYLDLGLEMAKLGEEARVYLPQFSLEGPKRGDLRNEYRRAAKQGASFQMLPPEAVAAQLPRLKEISDYWLLSKSAAEKGFSVGRFEPDYVRRFCCACVMRDDRIVAFATLWITRNKEEFSVDLMRYGADAPKGVMDYLFIELMLWGKREGYRWFNLGMAPLAGLERHPLAPFWHKLGRIVHRYGETIYNFEGLRRYKDKFGPQWRPRYLASPGGLVLPRVLLDTAALIAGGVREVVWK